MLEGTVYVVCGVRASLSVWLRGMLATGYADYPSPVTITLYVFQLTYYLS